MVRKIIIEVDKKDLKELDERLRSQYFIKLIEEDLRNGSKGI